MVPGMFHEIGLLGMLETSEYDALHSVFTFIGAIFDVCRGNLEFADVTESFTRYIDLVRFNYRRGEEPG